MRILLMTDVIHAGGAETFVLRLASALQKRGHKVLIYPLYKNRVDTKIASVFAPDIPVIPARLYFIRLLQILDGALRRLKIDYSVLNFFLITDLKKIIRKHHVEIIHSHLFTSDCIAVAAAKKWGIPVVTTIHGDYSAHQRALERGGLVGILSFPKKMAVVLKSVQQIVCISEEQLHFFSIREQEYGCRLPVKKIYNGFQRPVLAIDKAALKARLGIPADVFVFCMIARGIPEKGWEEVIQAFEALPSEKVYLLLIGSSNYIVELEKATPSKRIIFLGKQELPYTYLTIADAGLFASKIKTEALPTVIIEYLAAGLPVISTDVGECRRMLLAEQGSAGLLISSDAPRLEQELSETMLKLWNDQTLYASLQANTAPAFKKFDMEVCVTAYENVYEASIHSKQVHDA